MLKKILCKLIPEFKPILNKSLGYEWIENKVDNLEKDKLTKFYPPYSIVDSKVGYGTYISSNSKISNTIIGKFCSIGPNLVCGWGIHPTNGISTSPFFYSTQKQNGATIATENLLEERKKILIGNDVFIGANVTILDGVTIGDGVVIGAGAVVSKDIPDYSVAVGVPINIIKKRFDDETIIKLKKIKWWDFDISQLIMVNHYFFDIELFLSQFEDELE